MARPVAEPPGSSGKYMLASAVEPLLERYDADPGDRLTDRRPAALMLTIRDAVLDRVPAPFKRALDQAEARGDRHSPADAFALVHLIFSGVVLWEQRHGSTPTDDDCRRMLRLVLV